MTSKKIYLSDVYFIAVREFAFLPKDEYSIIFVFLFKILQNQFCGSRKEAGQISFLVPQGFFLQASR